METVQPLTWESFKAALAQHTDKYLFFQYAEGQFVDTSYHITEIKQAPIVSVDCGGKMNAWTEIIVQLWEPSEKETDRSMKVAKALSIINRVESILSLHPQATVKIEFGNPRFDTRQMYPGEFVAEGNTVTVNLTPDYTQCKARTRQESCGTSSCSTQVGTPASKPAELVVA